MTWKYIYLSCENFKTKWFNEKLDYWKIKVFKVRWQTELIMFKLELLKHSKAHFIVHTVLLESALKNAKLARIMNVKKYVN